MCSYGSAMFVRDASKRYGDKISPCKLLTESYRDGNGVPRHRTILNLSKLPENIANAIEQGASGKKVVSLEDITQEDNRSLGEITILKRLADRTGLSRILEKKLGRLVSGLVMAMVFNRISLPKAKYSVKDWLETNYLPELLKIGRDKFHHNRLYEALSVLAENQVEIEEGLWQETKQREKNLTLILYDISSTYLEGEQNDLAEYGYNRDGKKGKKQLVIALITTPQGRPVSIEVLPGNTADKATLIRKVEELKRRFGLKEVVYVFDRGMRDEKKLATLRSNNAKYITALTKKEIRQLIKKGAPIQPGLFDKRNLVEYQTGNQRYIICKSDQATRSGKVREKLLGKTEEKLEMIKKNVLLGRRKDPVKIAAWAEGWLKKWKMKKYFEVEIKEGHFNYHRRESLIQRDQKLDQLYVLETTEKSLSPEEVQRSYKNLSVVERDFRVIKSTLDIRPVHHRKEKTVRGHVFVCFLALYLRKELELQLQPLLEKHTFSYLLTQLREIRQSKLVAGKYQTQILNRLKPLQKDTLSTLQMRVSTIT